MTYVRRHAQNDNLNDSMRDLAFSPAGTKKTSRSASIADNSFMLCGIHKRPSNLPITPAPRDKYGKLFELRKKDRYKRALKAGEKRGGCDCDYHDYPALLDERRRARSDPKRVKKDLSIFLKLPPEIFEQILEHALVFDQGIEYCPEPFYFVGIGRLICSHEKEYEKARKHHYKVMGTKLALACAMMRSNRQLGSLATSIFYRGNEFRFTNLTGYITLDHFLFKIGLGKAAMLRTLTVCHPSCQVLPQSPQGEDTFTRGSIYLGIGYQVHKPKTAGFEYKYRWYDNPRLNPMVQDPILVLEKLGELQNLRWVLPALSNHVVVDSPINEAKFKNLQITILGLHHKEPWHDNVGVTIPDSSGKAEESVRQHNEKEETKKEWRAEARWIDVYGCYGADFKVDEKRRQIEPV